MDLERNLVDNILECEVKIGDAGTSIRFYYPKSSLLELLNCREEELATAIHVFLQKETNRLGKVAIEELKDQTDRYAVEVLEEGIEWVHRNYEPTAFMRCFVAEIQKRGNTCKEIIRLFRSFSENVRVEQISEAEWAVFFETEEIDPYVYYIEQNEFGLQYHRFTKAAYREKFSGTPLAE